MIDEQTIQLFRSRGFHVIPCATRQEAVEAFLGSIAPAAAVGIGGSVTVQELGLADTLRSLGHTVHWHWEGAATPDGQDVRRLALQADEYLMSANAISRDGALANIDGTGNRLAALLYGPPRVHLFIGRNKWVDTEADCVPRIKAKACPPNARRLGLALPCAKADRCMDCTADNKMCKLTLSVTANPSGGRQLVLYFIDEDLGY